MPKPFTHLAVMGLKRAPSMPNVPAAKESGVTNMNAASWNALAVSAKTPKDIVAKLNAATSNCGFGIG
jgi:tripartite-type tricarboxylate transporter receptor subunit TctC